MSSGGGLKEERWREGHGRDEDEESCEGRWKQQLISGLGKGTF